MDFDDIVAYAVSLVEGHEFVRHVLTSRYPVIYVDEYQDLAPGLDRLVKALCFDYYNSSDLFAVGDPDQAIYGWTGSRPELLDELGARSDVTRIYLDINYRSKAEIIKHSIRILDNFRRIRARNEDEGGLVEAHYVPGGYDAQVRAAAQLAVSRHNQAQR